MQFCEMHRFDHGHTEKEIPVDLISKSSKVKCGFCPQVDLQVQMIRCKPCQTLFCLQHRHQSDHACTFLKPQIKPKQDLVRKKCKNPNSNPKLELMRLKLNAKGNSNIQMADRVYLSVEFDSGLSCSVYYNKNLIIGKLVDVLCPLDGLVNKNNLEGAVMIGLVESSSGKVLPMGSTLQQVIELGLIVNGSSVTCKLME
jgi:hypothetical protein